MLSLAEELLLLALHDEKGKIVSAASMSLAYGLAGAVLLDLTLHDRLALEDKKLVLRNDKLTGDDILDRAIMKLRESKKNHKPDHWVRKLSGKKKMKDHLLDRLVNQGVLRLERRKVLRVFPVTRYPTVNGEPERNIRAEVREILLGGRAPDRRATMIISLIVACDLINEIFPRSERKPARNRAKEIARGEPIGKAVANLKQGARAAVIAAAASS